MKVFPKDKMEKSDLSFYNYLYKNGDSPRNYLVINDYGHNYADTMVLKSVEKGSNLFLCVENVDYSFYDTLHVSYGDLDYHLPVTTDDSVYLTMTASNFVNKSLKIVNHFSSRSYTELDKKTTTILSETKFSNGDVLPGFIRIKFGKGNVFLMNQPIVFTNYELLQNPGSSEYVEQVLSYLPKELKTVWFVKGQTQKSLHDMDRTELSVIFQYPALRAVWLIFLYGLLLFVLFNVKRRQRIVPIIKPLKNTTVEFLQTISNLYMQDDKNAKDITSKKINYFLENVRTKFYLDTNKLDEVFVKRLSAKSGKEVKQVQELMDTINILLQRQTHIDRTEFVHLSGLMEKLWEE